MAFKDFVSTKISVLQPGWKSKKLRSVYSDDMIPTLTGRMNTFRIRTMPVFDRDKNHTFSGIITQADLARYLPSEINILPIAFLKKKNFEVSELSVGSKFFETRSVGDVFGEVLNIGDIDRDVVIVDARHTDFLDSIRRFTCVGAGNRRYRTLMLTEDEKYVGVLSYLDVFNIFLKPEYRSTIEGFLISTIDQLLKDKKITKLMEADSLARAIYTLDNNPFTHIPVSRQGSNDIVGLVDEFTIRSLQYDVIYEYVEDINLGEILENQRPNFKDITVSASDTMEDALKKFTQSKTRPKTLLVGKSNDDYSVVSLKNTLSYSDVMQMFLDFAEELLNKSVKAEG
jgi:hypothetical protein